MEDWAVLRTYPKKGKLPLSRARIPAPQTPACTDTRYLPFAPCPQLGVYPQLAHHSLPEHLISVGHRGGQGVNGGVLLVSEGLQHLPYFALPSHLAGMGNDGVYSTLNCCTLDFRGERSGESLRVFLRE